MRAVEPAANHLFDRADQQQPQLAASDLQDPAPGPDSHGRQPRQCRGDGRVHAGRRAEPLVCHQLQPLGALVTGRQGLGRLVQLGAYSKALCLQPRQVIGADLSGDEPFRGLVRQEAGFGAVVQQSSWVQTARAGSGPDG